MHPLHDYVAKQLAEKLKAKKLVVWYGARRECVPFIGEVRGGARTGSGPVPVTVAGIVTRLAEYDGSMFELRAVAEPYVSGDVPESMVIYLPGCERDHHGSVLMELEKAGDDRVAIGGFGNLFLKRVMRRIVGGLPADRLDPHALGKFGVEPLDDEINAPALVRHVARRGHENPKNLLCHSSSSSPPHCCAFVRIAIAVALAIEEEVELVFR